MSTRTLATLTPLLALPDVAEPAPAAATCTDEGAP